jgi:hypothetical protein
MREAEVAQLVWERERTLLISMTIAKMGLDPDDD